MPVKRSRSGLYFLVAYAVLGAALFASIISDALSQVLDIAAVGAYIVGLFVLCRVAGYPPPFGWKAPNRHEKSAVVRDLSWLVACIVGTFGVVLIGVLMNPTSIIGVLLIAIPSVFLVALGSFFVARALSRFMKYR